MESNNDGDGELHFQAKDEKPYRQEKHKEEKIESPYPHHNQLVQS